MLHVGDPAPDFVLPDQDGTDASLHDFLGQWVVVYFYPKDDTPGCTEEACAFRDAYPELKKASVKILGISKDTVKSHKKFADKFNLNFTLLSDPDHLVIEHYGAWQEKSMYGKKYMGIQRSTFVINPEGHIAKIFPKVTPKGHEQEVLEAIGD